MSRRRGEEKRVIGGRREVPGYQVAGQQEGGQGGNRKVHGTSRLNTKYRVYRRDIFNIHVECTYSMYLLMYSIENLCHLG